MGALPVNLLWYLHFVKNFSTEMVKCVLWKCDEKTYRKWSWIFIRNISETKLVSEIEFILRPNDCSFLNSIQTQVHRYSGMAVLQQSLIIKMNPVQDKAIVLRTMLTVQSTRHHRFLLPGFSSITWAGCPLRSCGFTPLWKRSMGAWAILRVGPIRMYHFLKKNIDVFKILRVYSC